MQTARSHQLTGVSFKEMIQHIHAHKYSVQHAVYPIATMPKPFGRHLQH